jgi:hypothetical protein
MGSMKVPDKTGPAHTATDSPAEAPSRELPPAAQRALAEAAARRAALDAQIAALPTEKGGRGGLDPIRYGDWEIKGLTADF